MALTPDQWRAAAANPDLSEIAQAYRVPIEAQRAMESAAGAYVRQEQIAEQAFASRRDLAQTDVNIEMCRRQRELRLLIEANNAGPQE